MFLYGKATRKVASRRATYLSTGVRVRGMGMNGDFRNLGDPYGFSRRTRDIDGAIRKGKADETDMRESDWLIVGA